MRLIDTSHPFYRPAWRRYLLVLAPLAWAPVEWSGGNTFWAGLFAAIGVFLGWHLLIMWRPDDGGTTPDAPSKGTPDEPSRRNNGTD